MLILNLMFLVSFCYLLLGAAKVDIYFEIPTNEEIFF